MQANLAQPIDPAELRVFLALLAGSIAGLSKPGDVPTEVKEVAAPLLRQAIEETSPGAVIDALLLDKRRLTGGAASFSSEAINVIVTRLVEGLVAGDGEVTGAVGPVETTSVHDPCIGEGALAVTVASAIGATSIMGADIDPFALAISRIRAELAGLEIDVSASSDAKAPVVVCDAPTSDALGWVDKVRAARSPGGVAVAVVGAESLMDDERTAAFQRDSLLEQGELRAIIRLPDDLKAHAQSRGQAIVVLADRSEAEILVVDHQRTSLRPHHSRSGSTRRPLPGGGDTDRTEKELIGELADALSESVRTMDPGVSRDPGASLVSPDRLKGWYADDPDRRLVAYKAFLDELGEIIEEGQVIYEEAKGANSIDADTEAELAETLRNAGLAVTRFQRQLNQR